MDDIFASRRRFLLTCGTALASGCVASSSRPSATATEVGTPGGPAGGGDSWPKFGFDEANTGYNPASTGPRGDPKRAWEQYIEGYFTLAAPVVADGLLVIGGATNVYAIATADGRIEWTRDVGSLTHRYSPLVMEETVFSAARESERGDEPGTLNALDRASGEPVWRVPVDISSSPVPVGDTDVCFATFDGGWSTVVALDREDGSETWVSEVGADRDGSRVTAPPAVSGSSAFVASTLEAGGESSGAVLALDTGDGSERWWFETSHPAEVAPVVADGSVLCCTLGGTVHAIDERSGTVEWEHVAAHGVRVAPVVDDRRIYALARGELVALDRRTGDEEWHTTIEESVPAGVSVAADTVYVGGHRLTALDSSTGEVLWELPSPGITGTYGAPVVAADTLYTGVCVKTAAQDLYDHYVYAVE